MTVGARIPGPDPARRTFAQHVMGMPISVLVRGARSRSADVEAAVQTAFDSLRHADDVFSTYRADSPVSRLSRGEVDLGGLADDVRQEVAEVLQLCEQAREDTDGWFDHELPVPDGGRLDPSGLVKAWAVERAAACALARLDDEGTEWLVNAGGDVLVHAGGTLGGRPFSVGVESPVVAGRLTDVLEVHRGGVATSGGYRRGDHVRDPHTGRPARRLAAVTVTGPSLLRADVLATAVYAEGPPGLARVEGIDGYEALAVMPDATVRATGGWRGRVHCRISHSEDTGSSPSAAR